MWSKQLSGSEVTELYNSGTPLDANTHSASANLQAYWRMGNDPLTMVQVQLDN